MSQKRIRGNQRELSWESTKGTKFGARRTIHLLLFEAEKKTRLGEFFGHIFMIEDIRILWIACMIV